MRACFILLVMLCSTPTCTAEEISLDQVWAWKMPGTKDLRTLFAERTRDDDFKRLLEPLSKSAIRERRDNPCLLVLAADSPVEALRQASIPKKYRLGPELVVPREKPLFAYFYTYEVGQYAHIKRIESKGNTVTIHYELVPHKTKELTQHIALIPLGKASETVKTIVVHRLPLSKQWAANGFKPASDSYVAKSVSGSVRIRMPRNIPLDQVWSWKMPGTRDIRQLDKRLADNRTLVSEIRKVLTTRPKDRQQQKASILVVSGDETTALTRVLNLLTKGAHDKPQKAPSDEALFLFFYARQSPRYYHIQRIDSSSGKVDITYIEKPHETRDLTTHFALIPLGEQPPGDYAINAVRLPLESRYQQAGFQLTEPDVLEATVSQPTLLRVDPPDSEHP